MISNDQIKDRIHNNLKLVGEYGQQDIIKKFSNFTKSDNNINDSSKDILIEKIQSIQTERTLGLDSCEPSVQLLSILGLNTVDIYIDLFESLKNELTSLIHGYSEEELVELLNVTFPFLSNNELKSLPILIISKLKKIPNKYLEEIIKSNLLLKEFPISVLRQAWEIDHDYFIKSIQDSVEEMVHDGPKEEK